MQTNKLIFPLCGITHSDLVGVSGVNKRTAARKLGIAEGHFRKIVTTMGFSDMFPDVRPRPRCLLAKDISALAADGYNMKDAAFIGGVNYSYFKELVAVYGLRHLFPNKGAGSWISRRGYVGKNSE